LGIVEILVLLVVALVVLGPERLPEVLRTVAKILRELRSASNEVVRELTEALDDKPRPTMRGTGSEPPPERNEPNPPAAQP